MTRTNNHPSSSHPRWWQVPGSLRTGLLRLDGQVGTVVNTEKHVVDPAVLSGEVAGQLGQLMQQTGLGTDSGVVEPSSRAFGFESVKPGFTREAGSFRRQVPPHGLQGPGEWATDE